MKRLFCIIGFVLFAFSGFAIETLKSELTFVTYPVTRIYRSEKGIVVKLYTDTLKPRQMYLPQKWFEPTEDNSVRKANLLRISKWQKPYVVVYYKGTDFYQARLFMPDDARNKAWHLIPNTMDFSAKFDTDELVIE
ncbi:MAG: hypothetical protein IIW10_00555 [Spirochaetaceae bacterium]|nr:hypothetical protein [Spirochaetaceae bacterium]